MAIEKKLGAATRDAYGKALIQLGKTNPDIVVLDADLSKSTKTALFGRQFPDRFFDMGIQEANMVGVAAGLASQGKIPFVSSFACFLICKTHDQLRMSVAFPELNVKVVTSHGGISVGEDGASQQSIEDIALVCTLPGFVVMIPADQYAAEKLVLRSAEWKGPVYIRTGRPKAPIVYSENDSFQIGKGVRLREGTDVTLVANGLQVFEALCAHEALKEKGIRSSVVDLHTIKPLDQTLLLEEAKRTGAFVICEEHQIWGGLGSAVSTALSKEYPVPMEFVAIQDTYAESGKPDELLEKYGLTSPYIVKAAERVLAKKAQLGRV
ncbi:MAG TPA: transketolase family protein [Candidatus Omnitrophota bacterium]|nr:transketolase family protein [Candidatus Omnitrophota bacterium]